MAATLHFNPSLEYLADRVVSYITHDGRRKFNGERRALAAVLWPALQQPSAGAVLLLQHGAPISASSPLAVRDVACPA